MEQSSIPQGRVVTDATAGLISRVEELAYELKVEEVMTREVKVATPEMKMQEVLDLGQRFLTEVLRAKHVFLAPLDQIADRTNVGVLQAVVRANRKLELVHRLVEKIVTHQRRTRDVLVFVFLFFLFEVDEDRHVILHQLCCEADRVFGLHRTVSPDLDRQFVELGI